ncbi:putative aquaporin TIP4-1 [Vanrija pseudolonga]|uniref:Aquaporin TIP4-1 n=1 Tax=Vanrija pseudolonga TaxID=143232 RepID=A0AAF1BI46_9TREE|nr:putative aquaporin TIP4-1 [Vanrija pseudolonga]
MSKLSESTSHGAPVQITLKSATGSHPVIACFPGSFAPGARNEKHDPRPWYRCREYLLGGWGQHEVWRSAVVEGMASLMLVFVAGQIAGTLSAYQTKFIGVYIGVSNIFLISLFIFATAPASGGHINPVITFSTILCGICPVSRGVLYMIFQIAGAALAGGVLRGVWGLELARTYHGGGGCFFDNHTTTAGRVYLNEVMSTFSLLFLSYGVGLDPRQAVLSGPKFGPFLVGASLGLVSFASSGMIPGYGGAQMNPGRCFAYAIAQGDFSYHWIWWFGPAVGGIIQAIMYNSVPPFHAHESSAPVETSPPTETERSGSV